MRLLIISLSILTFLPGSSIFAQEEPCDLNHNGFIDIADLGAIVGLVGGADGLDTLPVYVPELDCDCDGLHLTVNDATGLGFRLIRGYLWGQGRQWWLPLDSLYIPETEISRGEEVDIPVYVNTDHPLTNIQFALNYEPSLLQIDGFTVSDSIPGGFPPRIYAFEGGISVIVYLAPYDDEIFYSGHLGNLRARALVASPGELETAIKFITDPHRALYNGICSFDYVHDAPGIQLFFTHPTTVDGIIRIIDEGRLRQSDASPLRAVLEAYPNPFNSSVEISVELRSDAEVEVAVFDLLGREVANLYGGRLSAGRSTLIWSPDDQPSGVYFCRLLSEGEQVTGRITLLR